MYDYEDETQKQALKGIIKECMHEMFMGKPEEDEMPMEEMEYEDEEMPMPESDKGMVIIDITPAKGKKSPKNSYGK